MNCVETARLLAGYLDGAIASREHARLRGHLDSCENCRAELQEYRRMAVCLANVEPVPVPHDLAVRIRTQASRAKSGRGAWSRALLILEDIVRPHAVPATGGILAALAIFVLLVQNVLAGVPMGGIVPNDLPLNLVQPAELESFAPFAAPAIITAGDTENSGAMLVEATVDARGEVVSYKILSGPKGPAVERQIDEVLMFSRFRPRMDFGQPADGGRVLLGFSEVHVHG
jgi:anti-sigma factor RsiW